jgi:Phosphoesterase family
MIRHRSIAVLCALGTMVAGGALTAPAVAVAAPNHPIVVIVMENKSYDKITKTKKADAPYINNTLIPGGKLFTNYTATTSGSVKDYLAMTSALIDVTAARGSDNIFNQLQNTSGVTWGEYEEDMPSTCYTGPNQTPYMKGHNPAVAYRDIKNNTAVCNAGVLKYSDFDPGHLRSFSYVVPNEYDDMHTGSSVDAEIQTGDTWLSQNVPAMLDHGAEVILTFDEGTPTNEHIVTLEIGAGVTPGTTDGAAYGHYSLLGGLQDAFGVSRLNGSVGVRALPL